MLLFFTNKPQKKNGDCNWKEHVRPQRVPKPTHMEEKPRNSKQPLKPIIGPKSGTRAVGSAKKEQCSMPRKEPGFSANQEDNLGLNVHVPEQMSCRPGDGLNCLQV
eukprot:Tbor_TRINITY_DN6200_c0_g1::TRINITY_DN6200_c0_g1_i2::g.1815::m.1815